jgi:hypothetical protein
MRMQEILDRCPPTDRPELAAAAAQYVRQWNEHDRHFREGILAGERADRRQAVAKALTFYRVIRRMERRYDVERGLPRLDPVLDALDDWRDRFPNAEDPVAAVTTLERLISRRYGGATQPSLASKLGWLVLGSPIAIYDSLVRDALGTKTASYEEFYAVWRRAYEVNAKEVREAAAQIGTAAATRPAEEWFAERVFDVFLWHVGNKRREARRARGAGAAALAMQRRTRPPASISVGVPEGDPQHLFDGWTQEQRAIADQLTQVLCASGLTAYRVRHRRQIRIGVPGKTVIAILEPRAAGLHFSTLLGDGTELAGQEPLPNGNVFRIHLQDATLSGDVVRVARAVAGARAGGAV